jgi:type II restriction/modification system DNA methylase subunit YeeA
LGKVFENLLASYNPETATTARKATGSYYTPKEIVDYMVEESLKEYFKTKTSLSEEKIENLFYQEEPQLSDEEKKELVQAIADVKIIDPACGSGAFCMGALHKLVELLNKIDPYNELWKEEQQRRLTNELSERWEEMNEEERKEEIEYLLEVFNEQRNYPDYGRKLYLIQNCIYGVDIQPIAVQLTKLRFFLSLILDQKPSNDKNNNFGILPLPHLETRFVCANTLIGLESSRRGSVGIIRTQEVMKIERELKRIRERYFRVRNRKQKQELEEKDRELREKLAELLKRQGWDNKDIQKIISFDILDPTAKADWFDPEWMFGVVDGFDIVIGNPPYVRQEKIKKDKPLLQKQGYEVFTSTADLYVYFYEKGYQLLKQQGVLAYITSNKWMRAKYGENLRKFLKEKNTIIKLVDFGGYRVFEQTVDTCILLFKKEKPPKEHTFEFLTVPSDVEDLENYLENANWQRMEQEKLSNNGWTLGDDKVLSLKEKIEKVGKPLKEWDVKIYRGVLTGYNDAFIIDTETRNRILANCKDEEERKRTEEIIKPVLRGRDIERYRYKWAGLWIICTFPSKKIDIEQYPALKEYLASFGERLLQDGKPGHRKKTPHKWYETQDNIAYYPEFEKEKIVWQEMSLEPSFAYDDKKFYTLQTAYIMTGENLKFILGLLNSKISKWYMQNLAYSLSEGAQRWIKQYVEQIPLPPITKENQPLADQIVQKVQEILTLTQSPDFETSQEKQQKVKDLEREIDQLVYKLYGLTEEEIKIIESN